MSDHVECCVWCWGLGEYLLCFSSMERGVSILVYINWRERMVCLTRRID
jgi:hypothetical protein